MFGLPYKSIEKFYPKDVDLSSACVSRNPPGVDLGLDVISCPATDDVVVAPSWTQRIAGDGRVGIYWSSKLGGPIPTGAMYLGPDAVSNPHYSAGPVQKAKLLHSEEHPSGSFAVNVTRITVGGQSYTGFACDAVSRPCVINTGTPILYLPMGVAVPPSNSTFIEFELAGLTESAPAVIKFNFTGVPFKTLEESAVSTSTSESVEGSPIMILGLPLWAQHYTVFDYVEGSVALVTTNGSFDYLSNPGYINW